MTKCPHDPKETHPAVEMYHCPECGEMVIAIRWEDEPATTIASVIIGHTGNRLVNILADRDNKFVEFSTDEQAM